MAKLQFVSNGETRDIPLSQKVTFGRAESNHVRLPHHDVSRVHAVIIAVGEDYVLQDLNSCNGVLVNGRRESRAELRHGDQITIGSYQFTYVNPPSAAAGATVAFRPPAPSPPEITPPPPVAPAKEMPTTAVNLSTVPEPPAAAPARSAPPKPATVPAPQEEIFFPLESFGSLNSLAGELSEISRQLAGSSGETTSSDDGLSERLIQALVQAIGADRGALVLRLPEGGLKLAASYPRAMQPNVSRVVLKATLREQQAILCNRASENPHFRSSPTMMRERVPALAAVPVLQRGTSVGFLYVDTLHSADLFRREHLPLLALIGQLICSVQSQALALSRGKSADEDETNAWLTVLNARYLSASKRRMKKSEALRALGTGASILAVPPLVAHLVDADPQTAQAALEGCLSFGRAAASANALSAFHTEILSLLRDPDGERRAPALALLRQLQPDRSPLRDKLRAFAADPATPAAARIIAEDLMGHGETPDSTFFLSSDSKPRQMDLRGR